jgi:hypothetical protein
MSQPRHAKRGDIPRAVPPPTPPVTPPGPDDERVAGRRRPLHAVPDVLPAPEPEEPAAPEGYPRIVCQLTPFELSLYVQGDPDFDPGNDHLEEGFHEWRRWDEAIDREPEIE